MNFRPGQFKRRQRIMGHALKDGSRALIRWPANLTAIAVWRAPAPEAQEIGARATTAP